MYIEEMGGERREHGAECKNGHWVYWIYLSLLSCLVREKGRRVQSEKTAIVICF